MTTDSREPRDEPPIAKRLIIGDPLTSQKLDDQLLPKRMALPIFASDALSSVAYAPQELLMILLTGGLAFLAFTPWVATAVVVVLAVVVISYRQLIRAYPSGERLAAEQQPDAHAEKDGGQFDDAVRENTYK